jgi:hypothetical protein
MATELASVNQILGAVGQAPVNSLTANNPEISIALDTLRSVTREVQAEGWSFNIEQEYPFLPDTNNEIIIPANVLQMKLSYLPENRGVDVTKRDGKLYNKVDHTFKWTPGREVKCDVVWEFPFEDVPQTFADFITARAAVIASASLIADTNQYKLLKDRELTTRAMALEADLKEGQYSMFGFGSGMNLYNSYMPFRVISR